jgi:isocitrate/isopropylmalate dehydrogenase
LLLRATGLLQFNGHADAARRILDATGRVLTARKALPPDLGGMATTAEMAAVICAEIGSTIT